MTVVVNKEDRRAWTARELKDYLAEVERLKSLWPPIRDPTATEALASFQEIYNKSNGFAELNKENQRRSIENDKQRKALLRRFELENRNLDWPKPVPFVIRPATDYWKNGCMYCEYKPKTTNDYEVHIITTHHGLPGYPGPADIEKYESEKHKQKHGGSSRLESGNQTF